MANINRCWKRVMAAGCTHGDLAHPGARKRALEFRRRFNPQIRYDLGDLIDTACFRSGAPGSKDEAKSPRDDHEAALRWLRQYEPNRIAWGNHDWRLHDLKDHPKAIVATLAGNLWASLEDEARRLKAKTAPYDIQRGWLHEGGVAWGHGYMFNMMAVRDHAEMLGCPVVMAHLHAPQQVEGRTVKDTSSFCVGALADDELLTYGRRRRQTLTHGHGIVYGELCDTEAHLWLLRAPNGQQIPFPPGI
jgi:hypothetical protein